MSRDICQGFLDNDNNSNSFRRNEITKFVKILSSLIMNYFYRHCQEQHFGNALTKMT